MSELTAEKIRQQYSYYAFISYSRKDEKWAKWLQTRLETYRLPSAIRKSNVDLPRKIAPVFRDKTDLAGIVLDEALHTALDTSKYLIVICSPNSAASMYVNEEIAYLPLWAGKKPSSPSSSTASLSRRRKRRNASPGRCGKWNRSCWASVCRSWAKTKRSCGWSPPF